MTNHQNRKRLPFSVFERGEKTASFLDCDHACLFALGRSRGNHLIDVVNKTGIVDQYQDGKVVPGQPGMATRYVGEREYQRLYEALKAIRRHAQSDGDRTFDDVIRDIGYIDDLARSVLANVER